MHTTVRDPRTMTQGELAEIVWEVREIIWGDRPGFEPAGPERRSALDLARVANFLEGYGLGPECDDADGPGDYTGVHAPGCPARAGGPCDCWENDPAVNPDGRPRTFSGVCWVCKTLDESPVPATSCAHCGCDGMEWA